MKRTVHAIVLACLLLLPGRQAAGEWTADIVDMPWVPPRFVAVDKDAQSFNLLSRQSPLRVLEVLPCATGQILGDKFREGDLKTPEGVYFITRRRSSGLNYDLYGDLAFPLNFPNPADVVRRKSGHGIWIHGRGHAITPFETQGCVALSTPDIHRVDGELAEGMPVVIAGEVRLGGPDAATVRNEAREVVEATKAWARAWSNRSEAFFDFHDPEKFSLTEGKPFAAFRSHKERLFKVLPWIKVDLFELHALPGPDYWVTYFVQLYRSPSLVSQGLKRLYWQRDADGRFRIIGMEYEEMPVTLAGNEARPSQAAAPDEAETDTRRPDSPSEEETQIKQLVDAHQKVMEEVARKAFASLTLKQQPTPEDEAILEVAQTGAVKPGFSPFASDALRQSPPAPPTAGNPASAPAAHALLQPDAGPRPVPAVALIPAHAVTGGGQAAARDVASAAPSPAPAPAAAPESKPVVAAIAPAVALAVGPGGAPAPAPAPAQATVAVAADALDRASDIAALMESWRKAWESANIDAYMACYADGARQGNLRGKDAIRRQKESVWRTSAPKGVGIEVVSIAPEGDGFGVVCAESYTSANGRVSKGYKNLLLASAGGELRIVRERWSRSRPTLANGVTPPPATRPAPASVAKAASPAPAVKADPREGVASTVESWRKAWENGRLDAYAGYYATDAVQGDRRGRDDIREQKVGLWKTRPPERVALSDMKIRRNGKEFVVTCVQDYRSRDGGFDHGLKTLRLAPSGDGFVIVEESWSRL